MLSMNTVNPTLEQIEAVNKATVIDKLEALLGTANFYDTITKATTDKNVITKRITDYTEFLQSIF
jgi:proline dehydrogenase